MTVNSTWKKKFNLEEIFLRLHKMASTQTEYARLEQGSIIKHLVAEKCKPCEICPIKCNMYGEACFRKKIKNNKNVLNMALPRRTRVEMTVHGVETQ